MHGLKRVFVNLRSSLWFVPGVMIVFSIALAFALIEVDSHVNSEWLARYPRLFGLGADGSRGMLTAIASSMLTVATLAFSLTLNAVTQASGQYTPRIFRNFMRDRANQFVLGYFVSVFAYCLIVLRTIRGAEEIKFVPSFAVITGLIFAVGGILVLIFFIHHIADSLQITTILNNVTNETKNSIEKIFPDQVGDETDDDDAEIFRRLQLIKNWRKIPSLDNGYIQSVDEKKMIEWSAENKVVIKMRRGIGQFVERGTTLAEIANEIETSKLNEVVSDEQIEDINKIFTFDRHRTIEQDTGFGIRQIVDIALKALSPGVNDTTTAVSCIDYLGEIMSKLAARRLPVKIRTENDQPRVVTLAPDFEDYVQTAFDQIRISGKSNQAIFERLLSTLVDVADHTINKKRCHALAKQVDLISDFAEQTLATDYEKNKVKKRADEAKKVFNVSN